MKRPELEKLVERYVENPPPKALAAANEGRVYKLLDKPELWLVEGEHNDYIVVPRLYCSCPWFQTRFVKEGIKPCYHVIAVELVRRGQGKAWVIEASIEEVEDIIFETIYEGRSRTLRLLRERGRVKLLY